MLVHTCLYTTATTRRRMHTMSDATHAPQQHVDVGARTLTPSVGTTTATRVSGSEVASEEAPNADESGHGDVSCTHVSSLPHARAHAPAPPSAPSAAASTSTSLAVEGDGSPIYYSDIGPSSTPSRRLSHLQSLESISNNPILSTAATSSKASSPSHPHASHPHPPPSLPLLPLPLPLPPTQTQGFPLATSPPDQHHHNNDDHDDASSSNVKSQRRSSLSKHKSRSRHSPRPSTSTSASQSPSAPVLVNSPPEMHLPGSLSGISGGSRPHRLSARSKGASLSPPTSYPDPGAFSISSILEGLDNDSAAAADIDAIARICGRSRLSLANEYGAHREPVGPGVRIVGEDIPEGAEAEAYEHAAAAAGLGVGFVGLPIGSGGLETVEETPTPSESERMMMVTTGGSEGSPATREPEEGLLRERLGLLSVWEGRGAVRDRRSGSQGQPGAAASAAVGSARPTSGVSNVEFGSRAELELGSSRGARENLMRLASA